MGILYGEPAKELSETSRRVLESLFIDGTDANLEVSTKRYIELATDDKLYHYTGRLLLLGSGIVNGHITEYPPNPINSSEYDIELADNRLEIARDGSKIDKIPDISGFQRVANAGLAILTIALRPQQERSENIDLMLIPTD